MRLVFQIIAINVILKKRTEGIGTTEISILSTPDFGNNTEPAVTSKSYLTTPDFGETTVEPVKPSDCDACVHSDLLDFNEYLYENCGYRNIEEFFADDKNLTCGYIDFETEFDPNFYNTSRVRRSVSHSRQKRWSSYDVVKGVVGFMAPGCTDNNGDISLMRWQCGAEALTTFIPGGPVIKAARGLYQGSKFAVKALNAGRKTSKRYSVGNKQFKKIADDLPYRRPSQPKPPSRPYSYPKPPSQGRDNAP